MFPKALYWDESEHTGKLPVYTDDKPAFYYSLTSLTRHRTFQSFRKRREGGEKKRKTANGLIDMLSTFYHPPTWMPLWSWQQSVSHSVCVAAAIWLPTRVSVASGLPLSDWLSTADSARSSDDDPGPGVGPRSLSCPHSFSFRGRTAASIHFTDGGREDSPCSFALTAKKMLLF